MNTTALSSAVHFLTVLLLLAVGAFFIALGLSPHLRLVVQLALEQKQALLWIGGAVLCAGGTLLVGCCRLHGVSYYQVSMGSRRTSVDPALIRRYVAAYWESVVPGAGVAVDVRMASPKQVEVVVGFPGDYPFSEQWDVLQRAETDLAALLKARMGYDGAFVATVLPKQP
jgi:hypothetical protein